MLVLRTAASAREQVRFSKVRSACLPSWVVRLTCDLEVVSGGDEGLTYFSGLHGLFLHGLGEPKEGDVLTVGMPSAKHVAMTDENSGIPPAALAASGGVLRFVELRFRSLAEARQRALLLYLCTFSARHALPVPLVSWSNLHSLSLHKQVLQLWEAYGLTL